MTPWGSGEKKKKKKEGDEEKILFETNLDLIITPENNTEELNKYTQALGLPSHLGFSEVFAINEPDLLALVPRPSYALLLIFPVSPTYEKSRELEDSTLPEYKGCGASEPVTWFKQTIRNACGTIGVLHALSNGPSRRFLVPDSILSNIIREAEPLEPVARANVLAASRSLAQAHATAAQGGDTAPPSAEDSIDLHFVCFVKGEDGRMWELDGRRKGPLERAVLGEDEDMLSEKALNAGPRRFMKGEEGDMRFSLTSLGPVFD